MQANPYPSDRVAGGAATARWFRSEWRATAAAIRRLLAPTRSNLTSFDRGSQRDQRLAGDCHDLVSVHDDLRIRPVNPVARVSDHHAFDRRVHRAVPCICEPDAIDCLVSCDACKDILQERSRVTKTRAAEEVEIVQSSPAKRWELGYWQAGVGASEPIEDSLGSIVLHLARRKRGRRQAIDVGLQLRQSGLKEAATIARAPKPCSDTPEPRKKELAREERNETDNEANGDGDESRFHAREPRQQPCDSPAAVRKARTSEPCGAAPCEVRARRQAGRSRHSVALGAGSAPRVGERQPSHPAWRSRTCSVLGIRHHPTVPSARIGLWRLRWPAFRCATTLLPRDDGHMTWVVGGATLDIGVLVGDIRISYSDNGRLREEARYGVQKLHQIVPSIWVGFAGSIEIGFAIVDQLREAARAVSPGGVRPEPGDVVGTWRAIAERNYTQRFAEQLRDAGCHLLVVGASQRWTEHRGQRLWRVARAYRIELPRPGERNIRLTDVAFNQFDSIGSGKSVEEYRDLLIGSTANGGQGLLAFSPTAGQGFGNSWHLAGFITSLAIGTVIDRRPEPGISTHLQSAVVTAEGTMFSNNAGADLFVDNGRVRRVPPLPRLAQSWAELQWFERRLARSPGSVAVG